MDGLRITACCFSFISLLLIIISLASDHWVESLFDISEHAFFGLWQTCTTKSCFSLGMNVPVAPYIHATRAFLLMGMFAGFVSFFGLCATFFRTHIGSVSIKDVAMIASFVAGVCSLIAMSSFTGGYYNNKDYKTLSWYGWSFDFAWASFPLSLITGGLAYKTVSTTTT